MSIQKNTIFFCAVANFFDSIHNRLSLHYSSLIHFRLSLWCRTWTPHWHLPLLITIIDFFTCSWNAILTLQKDDFCSQ
jgi:hypothetical protein